MLNSSHKAKMSPAKRNSFRVRLAFFGRVTLQCDGAESIVRGLGVRGAIIQHALTGFNDNPTTGSLLHICFSTRSLLFGKVYQEGFLHDEYIDNLDIVED